MALQRFRFGIRLPIYARRAEFWRSFRLERELAELTQNSGKISKVSKSN